MNKLFHYKKIKFFSLVIIILSLNSCKDKEPEQNHGSVELYPSAVELVCGETTTITPFFSENGSAKNKKYSWTNDNDDIATYKLTTGGNAEITAKRVGETDVKILSTDGAISAYSRIIVNPTIKFLPFIYFKSGESKRTIELEADGVKNATESTDDIWVYDRVSKPMIQQMYYFDKNDKLVATLVILEDTEENLRNAEIFIEERYKNLNMTTAEYINYYDATINPRYEAGTVVGIFLPTSNPTPAKAKGKLGIKYTSKNYM